MSNFLHKQSELLFKNKIYPYFFVSLLPFVPFGEWLALVTMSLITLRQGAKRGYGLLMVALVATVMATEYSAMPGAQLIRCSTLLLSYLLALGLRRTANWQQVGMMILFVSVIAIAYVDCFQPKIIITQINQIKELLNTLMQSEFAEQVKYTQQLDSVAFFSSFIFGAITLKALLTLLFARYLQSILFYPGAFKKELMAFRANRVIVCLLAVALAGAVNNYSLAASCLPILIGYVMMAGICLCLNILKNKKNLPAFAFIFLPLLIVPYIMLPFYVVFGSIDSMFNFRLRLNSKTGD